MKTDKKLKRQYFKIEGDKVIYPASVLSRVGARLIDFIIIWFPAFLIVSIYVPLNVEGTSDATSFSQVVPNQYDPVLMFSWAFTVFFAFFILMILPYYSKNPGQTLGKKLFKITPLYLGEKNEKFAYILRELPITILFILPGIFELALGFDAQAYYLQYNAYLRNNPQFDTGNPVYPSLFTFFKDYWGGNADITSGNNVFDGSPGQHLNTSGVAMCYLQVITSMIFLIVLIVLWISMLIDSQKRGYHDIASKTAVVNLKTITTLENAEKMYNELMGGIPSIVDENPQDTPIKLDTDLNEEKKQENNGENENLIVDKNKESNQKKEELEEESNKSKPEIEKEIEKESEKTKPKEEIEKDNK
ncbi:MAG: hypothetical protein HPAVJP_2000 [Candidatus Hepatoplasma vulgare]|nr:MAG: hypothetical protein HPAVJP_2000 [Candidatus Hepatoplasma sp.]